MVRRFAFGFMVAALLGAATFFPATVRTQSGPAFQSPISCSQSVPVSITGSATTELVALTTGQRVHVCGFVLQSAAAATTKFVTGHGTACATSQADLSGVFTFTATPSAVPLGGGSGSIMMTVAGDALCVVNTGGQVSGVVAYIKF